MENQQTVPSAEEMLAKKKELIESYKEETELLEVQLRYEGLIADIEEARLRRLVATVRQSQIIAPPPKSEEPDPSETKEPAKSRTLRKKDE